MPLEYLWLIPLGFIVGAYGTLIGAGGGFVLVPFLLILYPRRRPKRLPAFHWPLSSSMPFPAASPTPA